MLFYDFEVFKYYTLCVVIDMTTQKTHVIDTREEMIAFYEEHKKDIWCGYNSKDYDQYILKGWLMGYEAYKINDWIINQNQPGWKFSRAFRKVQLNGYDCIVKRGATYEGLKALQYHMGSSIVECDVPFTLDRPLTDEEKETVIEYCKNDVIETINVFLNSKKRFDAHLGLVKMYKLPLSNIDNTDAQITAKVLNADRVYGRNDEFDIRLPETLRLNKYRHIADWYLDKNNHDYDCHLSAEVAGIKTDYGYGGFHAARPKCQYDGFIVDSDVGSLYPSLMIKYGLVSRNVEDPSKFEEIKELRMKLKAKKDPMQEALKLAINSSYGVLKDKNNAMYDPLMSNLVCIYGQLLMTDLIEKLENALGNRMIPIQYNTDGIFVKLSSKDDFPLYEKVCAEWSERTQLDLEHEFYTRIVQKDVNNYVAIREDGSLHRKGAYVKELGPMDCELAIVNKAVVDYLTKDIAPEDTIKAARYLKDFQMCCKLTSNYDYLSHGKERLEHKYYRVFASKDHTDEGMFKVKAKLGGNSKSKIANTPEYCFIDNEDVNNKRCPRKLNRDYYIKLAYNRLEQFIGHDVKQLRLY